MIRSTFVLVVLLVAVNHCNAQDSCPVMNGDSALQIAKKSGGNYYKDKFGWRAVDLLDTTETIWTVTSYKSRHKFFRRAHSCIAKRWERTMVIDGRTGEIISRNKRKYIDTNCPPYF